MHTPHYNVHSIFELQPQKTGNGGGSEKKMQFYTLYGMSTSGAVQTIVQDASTLAGRTLEKKKVVHLLEVFFF